MPESCLVCDRQHAQEECPHCGVLACPACAVHHRCADYDADEPDSAPTEGLRGQSRWNVM